MARPIIAIVGVPNVGKSTFFNRLLSQRQSIVDAEEGITRDRIYGSTEWNGQSLEIIDTGGYIPEKFDLFNKAIRKQVQDAMDEADLVLFMVDGKKGPTTADKILAQSVRACGKPCIVTVNKCDNYKTDGWTHEFYEFGFENILPISALNGRLTGNLLDAILDKLDLTKFNAKDSKNKTLRLSIVGMPNVGKSSLTNALLQKERSIVTPVAGTTRDAIDANLKWYGHDITLVDTAGIRKLAKLKDKIEYYSTLRTKKAIMNSNVVLILIDSKKGLCRQDKHIINDVIKKGKGLVLVINKWDLIEKETYTMKNFKDELRYQFRALENYPIIFISALTKQRIHNVLETVWEVYKRSKSNLSTKKLNETLKHILSKNPPTTEKGKSIKIKYATQISKQPTIIGFYTNYPKKIKSHYQRYIENQLRKKFNLKGVPMILSFRLK